MPEMKCPTCGCMKFYVKDPDDEYETCEFECRDGEIVFSSLVDESEAPEIKKQTETFCDRCVWHGEFGELEKP